MPSSTEEAIGFSTRTWTPRAMQVSAMSRCRCVGAAMVMASTSEVEQFLDVGDGRAAERAGDEIGLLAIGIGDADQFGARQAGEHAGMIAAHDADADDADTQWTLRVRMLPPASSSEGSPAARSAPSSPSMAGRGWRPPWPEARRTRFDSKRYKRK